MLKQTEIISHMLQRIFLYYTFLVSHLLSHIKFSSLLVEKNIGYSHFSVFYLHSYVHKLTKICDSSAIYIFNHNR